MAIPGDVRQFQLKHMLWMTLSLCLPLSLVPYMPAYGIPLLVAVASFWIGMGCLFISDLIDNRPIDDRGWISQAFNVLGLFVAVFSLLGAMFFTLFIVVVLLSVYFQLT